MVVRKKVLCGTRSTGAGAVAEQVAVWLEHSPGRSCSIRAGQIDLNTLALRSDAEEAWPSDHHHTSHTREDVDTFTP